MAAGAGIKLTRTVERDADIADGARLIRAGNATAFVLLRVKPTDPPSFKRDLDPANSTARFRAALLGRRSNFLATTCFTAAGETFVVAQAPHQ